MNICFISDVEYGVHQLTTKGGVICILLHFSILTHLSHAFGSLVDESVSLSLHRFEHFFLLLDSELRVEVLPLFVLLFTECSIFNNDFLALISPPCFVIKLFFLVRLPFHKFKDHGFAIMQLQIGHQLLLLANEPSAPLFPLFSGGLCQCLLGALLETCRSEGEGTVSC